MRCIEEFYTNSDRHDNLVVNLHNNNYKIFVCMDSKYYQGNLLNAVFNHFDNFKCYIFNLIESKLDH